MTKDSDFSTRESAFAELLLSFITALTTLSCLLMIRGFNEYITVTTYTQLIPLLLVPVHTFIRRRWPKLLPCFLLHIASTVIFYLAVILIPFTGYGANSSNKIYLLVIVILFTISSYSYRLNPRFVPSNSQVITLPLCIFPIFGVFYILMRRSDIISDLIFNTLIIAVMYIVMRQVAVFDVKYYHSIRNSSRPASHLKRQNYKTAAALVGIFILSLGVLKLIPIGMLTNIVVEGLQALVRAIIPIIIAFLDFFANFFQEVEKADEALEEMADQEILFTDERWTRVIGTILAVLILIGFVLLIINTIRLLIINAPRYRREKETDNGGIVIDTIEDIKPVKTSLIRRNRSFGRGYERRIRKQFYDKAVQAMKRGLPVSDSSTPGQIEAVLTENGDKDFSSLRQEYEKVRYGKK